MFNDNVQGRGLISLIPLDTPRRMSLGSEWNKPPYSKAEPKVASKTKKFE